MTTKILTVELKAQDAVNGIINLNNAIAKNNEQIKANSDLIKKNNKDIEAGTGDVMKLTQQNQVLAKSNVELTAKTKVLKDERKVLQKETQNEIKLQTEEIGSMKQMEAELRNLKLEYKRLSDEEREHGKRGKELRDSINKTTTELKKAEYGIQEYYRNVGNYENAILNALGMNGKFGQSIKAIAGAESGFATSMSSMGASVKAFGASLWALMSNPVFIAIAGIAGAGMAFKWFYDYNVEVEHAMRLTREFTGVAGDELVRLRAEIQATASTYGKEYQEVLEGVDLLMSHFGLTSEQAMRTLNDGFMIGADINGNYLQLLKQYAPVFKDAGVSAEQLVALIQQTRSGIFSQQGLEAIKQASARIREMSKGTRDSLQGIGIDVNDLQRKLATHEIEMIDAVQMVSDKLKETGNNTQEYGNVMADVFGRQGKFSSQEMIESLGDIDTNLQNLKESAGEYGKALDENQQATADLEEETARFFGVGENGWETLKTRADTYWKQGVTNAIKKTRELLGRIADLGRRSQAFRQAAQIIAGVIWQLTGGIVDMIRGIGSGFKAMGSWINAFVTTFKSAFGIIKDLGRGVADILTGDVSKGINEISSGLSKGINNALKGINTALKDTANHAKTVFTGFRNGYNVASTFFDKYTYDDDNFSYSTEPDNNIIDTSPSAPSNPSGGGSRNKGGGGRNKGGGNKKNAPKQTTPKETPEQKAAREAEAAFQKRMNDLIAEGEKLKMQALQERAKTEAKAIDELAEAQKQAIIKKYGTIEELQARLAKATTDADKAQAQGAIDGYNALMADVEKKRSDAILKMVTDNAKARADAEAKAQADAKTLAQTWLAASVEGTKQQLDWQLKLIEMEKQAELAAYEGNEQMKAAITAKYAKQEQDARMQSAQAIQQIEQTKYAAIGSMLNGLGQMLGEVGDEQSDFAALQKTLALGEIMIAQAVAIANAIKNASQGSITVWDMMAQIATGITAVTVAMAQAFKSLDAAKFATGGYIQGAGTSTSDSIPVRVSNGESIMNANTTAMFGGLLSSLNQLGGGVPIQVQETASSVRGEDMLARAVARGVAMLPAPVVSVQDINQGQRQVEVMNERATL